jgi:hypothetical protein
MVSIQNTFDYCLDGAVSHLDIILPFVLLLLTYIFKLTIDEKFDKVKAMRAFCELPIDIIFLAMSFLIAIMLSQGKYRDFGVLYVMVFIVVAVITVVLSKRSVLGFNANLNRGWIAMLVGNIIITLICLVCSISTLTKAAKLDKEKKSPKTELSIPKTTIK